MRQASIFSVVVSCIAWNALSGNVRLAEGALAFNVSFDPSTANAPAGFVPAFDDAIQFIEATYSDPIVINIQVGWGEIGGQALASGDDGESIANGTGFHTFAEIKSLLINDKKSADDATAVANLPATDLYGGTKFTMSSAQGKALGLISGNSAAIDGYVGFNSASAFTFDPANRAVPAKIDFIALAEHEITEVMGRFGLTQNGASSGRYSPIDLFRYLSPDTLDIVPASHTYFSIDGGQTVINRFNVINNGDLSDWQGFTADAFNVGLATDNEHPFSAGDMTLMDVIGYDRATVPEPSMLTLLAAGAAGLLTWRRLGRQVTD